MIMKAYAMKFRRSGWPATTTTEVVEKWDLACQLEDEGVRSIHRARELQVVSKKLEKEQKRENLHMLRKDQISAPLILDPTSGDITAKMKQACLKFEEATGFHWAVRTRAGEKKSVYIAVVGNIPGNILHFSHGQRR